MFDSRFALSFSCHACNKQMTIERKTFYKMKMSTDKIKSYHDEELNVNGSGLSLGLAKADNGKEKNG